MAGSMQVILTEDIPKLGEAGEVVKVRAGFGRNYLLPQGKAMLATPGRVKQLEHQRRVVAELQRKEVAVQDEVARSLAKIDLTFEMQASAEGKLFGSVTNADIGERLQEGGCKIDRRKIELGEPIKRVGQHTASVRLHSAVTVELEVNVVAIGVPEAEESEEGGEASAEEEPRSEGYEDSDVETSSEE